MDALIKLEHGRSELRIVRVRRPCPDNGQVVLEVFGGGLCGTDLHILEDEYPSNAPVTLGHEISGIVRRLGPDVDPAWQDARVAVESFFSTCEHCSACVSGHRNLCSQRQSIGSHTHGGFAQELLIPVRNLHRLPNGLDIHAAALLEPLGCVVNCIMDPGRVQAGDRVLVTGPGPVGLLAAQVARGSGGQVVVAGTSADNVRLDAAMRLGFDVAVVGQDVLGSVDVAIECSGNPAATTMCLERLVPRGQLVQIGLFGRSVSLPLDLVCSKGLSYSSAIAAPTPAWRRAMALVESGVVQLEPLVSEVVPLREWERAFQALRKGSALKFIFDPHL
jgi:L-iditol 2-dehydrogenase